MSVYSANSPSVASTNNSSINDSWREPVEVVDINSVVLPVGTPGNTINVDGEIISDAQRVLFSNPSMSPNGPNVYIYDQTSGTFIEDVNEESSGDKVYVNRGTYQESVFTYNGTSWDEESSTTNITDELQDIRDFIGKDGQGPENPNYSSTNQITQNSSLETAISELDLSMGSDVVDGNIISSTSSVNDNIQSIADYLESTNTESELPNTNTASVLDSVDADFVKWVVYASDDSTPTQAYSVEISAIRSSDTAEFNYNEFSILRTGNTWTVPDFAVTLNSGNLELNVSAASQLMTYKTKRITIIE